MKKALLLAAAITSACGPGSEEGPMGGVRRVWTINASYAEGPIELSDATPVVERQLQATLGEDGPTERWFTGWVQLVAHAGAPFRITVTDESVTDRHDAADSDPQGIALASVLTFDTCTQRALFGREGPCPVALKLRFERLGSEPTRVDWRILSKMGGDSREPAPGTTVLTLTSPDGDPQPR